MQKMLNCYLRSTICPGCLVADSKGKDHMTSTLLVLTLAYVTMLAETVVGQIPPLPEGAKTHWVVGQPQEIVTYLAFDPATVKERVPPTLRLITIRELATGGVRWAMNYFAEHPLHGDWGISFLEIARMRTFTIDGLAPDWPEHGAAALWCARVAPSDSTKDLRLGRPFLVLDFWMPDSIFAAYMCKKGHYATYGDARLWPDSEGKWHGSVSISGLSVVAECIPAGSVTGGIGSSGMQALFPPQSSTVTDIVRVSFAGHREQQCKENSSWRFLGSHPLVHAVALGSSIYQFGYTLIGGAYPR
jgi:hypothetical protein